MERFRKFTIMMGAICSLLLFYSTCGIANSEAARADAKLKRVALFKNGLGFFVLEVTVPSGKERFIIIPPGKACHGTFWVSHPSTAKLEAVTVKEIESQEFVDVVFLTKIQISTAYRTVTIIVLQQTIRAKKTLIAMALAMHVKSVTMIRTRQIQEFVDVVFLMI